MTVPSQNPYTSCPDDGETGPQVRLWAATRDPGCREGRESRESEWRYGRGGPIAEPFDLITSVTADGSAAGAGLSPAQDRLLALCRTSPRSVADLASLCGMPVSVVRAVLGELHEAGHIHIGRAPAPAEIPAEGVLRGLIDGLRGL